MKFKQFSKAARLVKESLIKYIHCSVSWLHSPFKFVVNLDSIIYVTY